RVFWPWVAAGDAGKGSVVWYQTGPGQLPDNHCHAAAIHAHSAGGINAPSSTRKIYPAKVVSRPIHSGLVCQGGATCVATGQDRRLGDYFTNAIDARGCVLVATGDTPRRDQLTGAPYPTARPLFIRQNAGPALIGTKNCS